MRNTVYLFGVLLTAGAMSISAIQTHAAEPASAQSDCRTGQVMKNGQCASARPVRAVQPAAPVRVTKAALDRAVCGKLQTQVERDTCLNRVEATA